MSCKRFVVSVAAVSLGLVLLGGCGQVEETSGAPTGDPRATGIGLANAGKEVGTKLTEVEIDGLGKVLADQDGFTLYRFDNDTNSPPTSNCDGDCASVWPPVTTDVKVETDGVDPNVVDTITRADGTSQVTVGGWPVYRYAQDTAPGQANGQGVGGTWFGVTATGGKAGQETPPPAPEEPADADLVATEIPGFGPALTDAQGRTLYLFTNDSKDPSQTTCVDDCAAKWPPLTTEDGSVTVQGVDENLVDTVTRPDGTEQITVGGWPVYRFAKDTAAGQTNGHGVGDTWFVIEPAGCKSSVPVQEDSGY